MESEVTAAELEYRAEATIVTIVPNFDLERLECISVCSNQGTFGPFRASLPSDVPLWLAVFLKKRQKCRIIPPAWMDLGVLRAMLEEERSAQQTLTQVDFHYLEISSILLSVAKDNIPQKTLVMNTIEDLYGLRLSKIRQKLKAVEPNARALNLTNISAMELQTFRRMITNVFNSLNLVRGN